MAWLAGSLQSGTPYPRSKNRLAWSYSSFLHWFPSGTSLARRRVVFRVLHLRDSAAIPEEQSLEQGCAADPHGQVSFVPSVLYRPPSPHRLFAAVKRSGSAGRRAKYHQARRLRTGSTEDESQLGSALAP